MSSENHIHKFTIYGERCSGTHFLQYALLRNFHLEYVRGQKHFFGHSDPNTDENMLSICIVRNPIDWIDSFFKRLHHVPPENRNIDAFLKNEFYSIYETKEDIQSKGIEIMEDRNYLTGERYRDIFELRKIKNDFFLSQINKKAKYVCILKYEDLRDNYKDTLDKLKNTYGLKPKHTDYVNIEKYKGTYNALYTKKPVLLNTEVKQYIIDHVDLEQEAVLGYTDLTKQ